MAERERKPDAPTDTDASEDRDLDKHEKDKDEKDKDEKEDQIDEKLDETFPASDPPAW